MGIYLTGTGASALCAYFYQFFKDKSEAESSIEDEKKFFNNKNISRIFILLSFLPLFLISALRYGIGTDYIPIYVKAFEHNFTAVGGEHFEIGFKMLTRFIMLFTNNSVWLFVVTSFIFCFFMYKAICDQSTEVWFSILLLVFSVFYFMSFNVIRQCIGIAIFLYSIKYIKKREFLKYLFFIILASTIHISMLIYLPLYFILNIRVNIKVQFGLLAVCILGYKLIVNLLIAIVKMTRYKVYFDTQFDNGVFSTWTLIINVSILIFIYVFYRKAKDNDNYNIFMNLQLVTVILNIFSGTIPLTDRLTWCFAFSGILFLPEVVNYIDNKKIRNIIKVLIIICYAYYGYHSVVVRGYHEVVPYVSIFR